MLPSKNSRKNQFGTFVYYTRHPNSTFPTICHFLIFSNFSSKICPENAEEKRKLNSKFQKTSSNQISKVKNVLLDFHDKYYPGKNVRKRTNIRLYT